MLTLESFEDWIRLEETLNGDAVESFKVTITNPATRTRRVFAHAVFAYVEGMAYLMRQNCLLLNGRGVEYSAEEVALLKEQSYSLDDKGQVQQGIRRLDLRRMLRFTFAMFARPFDSAHSLDCSGDGWRNFSETLLIRNRVTHPRRGADLEITDNELRFILAAFTWFKDQIRETFGRLGNELERRTKSTGSAGPDGSPRETPSGSE